MQIIQEHKCNLSKASLQGPHTPLPLTSSHYFSLLPSIKPSLSSPPLYLHYLPSSQRALLQSPSNPSPPPQPPLPVDSDVVVVLAALLCALICLVGLALVARCAWLRRSSSSSSSSPFPPASTAAKGLKKKAISSLPKFVFDLNTGGPSACPICLAEFRAGDELRALPRCGHRFHVACVDTWLAARSSCPSCRRSCCASSEFNL